MPSARETELLEAAYRYVLTHGLADVSLRPLAAAIGSSTRVLFYLFGSKDGLVRALLARARADELALLADIGAGPGVVLRLWEWLSTPAHRPLLTLWLEAYARSLVEPDGAWAGFAKATVEDWLEVLEASQAEDVRETAAGLSERTRDLALLRGALLDLLATGDGERVTAAVRASFAE
ncbi:TetR/AcrR family transcriptional regulator [Lentzea sp.]|uniref:TetR/AcrR family transcriptional regulator n=1 Tax=Lentzea sp. TaxID=56099 RepID=UPI002C367068|nr:TetR family transcriptional regulator [Lentzea sp.]HUQ56141.1 TetR family transcriptional regulator [Lentzea sp.]